jgi:hypothetical protein
MVRGAVIGLALCGAVAVVAAQVPAAAGVDAAFATFLQAPSRRDAVAAIDRVAASGVSVDETLRRLKIGRSYARDVPRGVVQASHKNDAGEYYYTLDVPETYDSSRKYQVRVQLHGGVGRIESNAPPRAGSNARLAGVEQIYVMPYAWKDAPWWSGQQTDNLDAILDLVKRAYNVDENRIVLSGISDGGTGTYYAAMRNTTPFASFLPFIGFIGVLRNETLQSDGDLFPNNLLNKPMFVVNGGRDPQYPTSMVDPFIDHLKKGGASIDYHPQPNAAHDTSWWPELKDAIEAFVTAHPRQPFPDTLTWETDALHVPARAHWLVIDRLAPRHADQAPLPDVNRMPHRAELDFGIRGVGTRINRVVKGSNAEQIGLKSGDVVVSLSNQPLAGGADLAEALRNFPAGRPLILSVQRGAETVRVTGRYAPTAIAGEADAMLPPQSDSGRVDLKSTGNRIEATTRGVGAFTLLLSPDQFDLTRSVTVVVNGQTAFEGVVKQRLDTLLKWSARDNDRTMLFTAELSINIPE